MDLLQIGVGTDLNLKELLFESGSAREKSHA
jgi:hypothetical protein